jgi:hypothetical protein
MARVRLLEGREAGILADVVQGLFRLTLGRPLNPIKVYAHAPRAMLAPVLPNMVFEMPGRWAAGREPTAQYTSFRSVTPTNHAFHAGFGLIPASRPRLGRIRPKLVTYAVCSASQTRTCSAFLLGGKTG